MAPVRSAAAITGARPNRTNEAVVDARREQLSKDAAPVWGARLKSECGALVLQP